ncbi:MAG TPA: nucleotidyltransferase family protein [Nocardioides sp.]|nr:nucleotidyltransferase family protein [Nocardioides sp.]
MTTAIGLLLAAGAGTRMGRPKALVFDDDGTSWLVRGVETLHGGGCHEVVVVLGAGADEARRLVPDDVAVVVAADWAEGMSASLRAGLDHLEDTHADAALVTLVDLPDVTDAVVRRVLAAGADGAALIRTTYDGRPGHPVVLGREHWFGVRAAAVGDRGARDYLANHALVEVECGDLATGADVDSWQV